VKKIGANTYLLYTKMKKISVVSSRDICVLLHFVHEANGDIKVCTFSVRDPDVPEKKGCVRAELLVSLFISDRRMVDKEIIRLKFVSHLFHRNRYQRSHSRLPEEISQ